MTFQNNIKTFTEYCQQKSTLLQATKHTVEVLLEKAGTQNCQQANRKLTSLTKLNLGRNQIRDVKPLSTLTNLNKLYLFDNQVMSTLILNHKSQKNFLWIAT